MGALTEDDVRAIEALHGRWLENERAGNAKAVLDLCDDDVLLLPPGGRPFAGDTRFCPRCPAHRYGFTN